MTFGLGRGAAARGWRRVDRFFHLGANRFRLYGYRLRLVRDDPGRFRFGRGLHLLLRRRFNDRVFLRRGRRGLLLNRFLLRTFRFGWSWRRIALTHLGPWREIKRLRAG